MRGKRSEVKGGETPAAGEIRVVVDKKGQTFERGAALPGKPGLVVKSVREMGNYYQVDFVHARAVATVPPPVLLHAGDVAASE